MDVTDVICCICRGILIRPVSLPCQHRMCLACFDRCVQETGYSCPVCRRRVSNWMRRARNAGEMVDSVLWQEIKKNFPEEVSLKLRGEDDKIEEKMSEARGGRHLLAKPGEIAEEFSRELSNFRREEEQRKRQQDVASIQTARRCQRQEDRDFQIFKQTRLMMLRADEEMARKMERELNEDFHSPDLYSSPKKDNLNKMPPEIKRKTLSQGENANRHWEGAQGGSAGGVGLEVNDAPPNETAAVPSTSQCTGGGDQQKKSKANFPWYPVEPSTSTGGPKKDKVDDLDTMLSKLPGNPQYLDRCAELLIQYIQNDSDSEEEEPGNPEDLWHVHLDDDECPPRRGGGQSRGAREPDEALLKGLFGKEVYEEHCLIEQMLLQEKQDRGLALCLSEEWAPEVDVGPLTRAMTTSAVESPIHNGQRSQQALLKSLVKKRSNKKK